MTKALELKGKKFGNLKVIERAGSNRHGQAKWLCECLICGATSMPLSHDLISSKATSCGRHHFIELGRKRADVVSREHLDRCNKGDINWRITKDGYMVGSIHYASEPAVLRPKTATFIFQHWYVFWINNYKADWVAKAKNNGALIHHKNGIRNDNRIENLELWVKRGHPRGVRAKDMLEWAIHTVEQLGGKVIFQEGNIPVT